MTPDTAFFQSIGHPVTVGAGETKSITVRPPLGQPLYVTKMPVHATGDLDDLRISLSLGRTTYLDRVHASALQQLFAYRGLLGPMRVSAQEDAKLTVTNTGDAAQTLYARFRGMTEQQAQVWREGRAVRQPYPISATYDLAAGEQQVEIELPHQGRRLRCTGLYFGGDTDDVLVTIRSGGTTLFEPAPAAAYAGEWGRDPALFPWPIEPDADLVVIASNLDNGAGKSLSVFAETYVHEDAT